jgi:Terpene cyclase DEP1
MNPIAARRQPIPVTALQIFWGLCAIIGLLGVGWPAWHAPEAKVFFAELGQSWSGITVSSDLLVLGLAAVAFVVIEARRLGMPLPWIWVPLAIPLPGAFLIPLFFLLRERALLRLGQAGAPGAGVEDMPR